MFIQSSVKLSFIELFFTISIRLGDVYRLRIREFHPNFCIFVIFFQFILG